MTCSDCKCFEKAEVQPEGIPEGVVAGFCFRYPPMVCLRPQQVGSALLPEKQQLMMVPGAYYPPILSTNLACGEIRVKVKKRK